VEHGAEPGPELAARVVRTDDEGEVLVHAGEGAGEFGGVLRTRRRVRGGAQQDQTVVFVGHHRCPPLRAVGAASPRPGRGGGVLPAVSWPAAGRPSPAGHDSPPATAAVAAKGRPIDGSVTAHLLRVTHSESRSPPGPTEAIRREVPSHTHTPR